MPETKCSKTTSISLSDTASDEPLSCAVKTKRNLIIRPLEQVVYLSELLNFEVTIFIFALNYKFDFVFFSRCKYPTFQKAIIVNF